MFPLCGLEATLRQSLGIGAIFTLVLLLRSYSAAAFRGLRPDVSAP